MKTRVLVTGANSMLGVNVLERLIALGYEPVALVRHSTPEFDHLPVTIIKGNVTQLDDIRRGVADCQAIIHIAANTNQNLLSLADYLPINVEAVKFACAVACEKNIRLVLVSSANTIGNGTSARLADESYPPLPPFSRNLYARSKILAEQAAIASGANVVIVNPTFIIGAHDAKPSSGQAVVMAYGRRVVLAPTGGKNFVSARDVAFAIVAALTCGTSGERYLAAGPAASNLSFSEFYRMIARIDNRPITIMKVPRFAMVIAGTAGSLLRLLGAKIPTSITNMTILATREYYSSARAVRELGMTQTPLDEALRECIEWLRLHDKLKH